MAYNLRLIWVSGAALLCVLAIAVSCRRQTETPAPKPVEILRTAPDQVFTQVVSNPPLLQSATNVVEYPIVSTNGQILSLKTEILETAGRRGAAAGKLAELYRNALVVDDAEIAAMDAEIAAKRAALVTKIAAFPEVLEKRKALDEIERKKKDLLASRNAMIEAGKKPSSETGAPSNTVEQVRAIEANLRILQKESQVLIAEHRNIVQQVREKNAEISGLAAEIMDKEAARAARLDSLPGIKELRAEQLNLESRMRDLNAKLRLLEDSQSATKVVLPSPPIDVVVPLK